MKFLGWYSLIMLSVSALLNVASVGQPRKPATGGTVALALILISPIIGYVAFNLFR